MDKRIYGNERATDAAIDRLRGLGPEDAQLQEKKAAYQAGVRHNFEETANNDPSRIDSPAGLLERLEHVNMWLFGIKSLAQSISVKVANGLPLKPDTETETSGSVIAYVSTAERLVEEIGLALEQILKAL